MSSPNTSAHPTGRCTDRGAVARLAASFGLEVLHGEDIARARDVGASMIGQTLASAHTLAATQEAAQAVVFGYRENGALTGMMALLPLNAAGLARLCEGTFDSRAPDLDTIARPGQEPACYYAWGIAATSKDASRALIRASSTLHTTLFWAIPSFTRAVTPEGARLMSSFGYRPFSPSDPELIIAPSPGRPAAPSQ